MNMRLTSMGAFVILAGLTFAASQDILLRRELRAGKDVYDVEMSSASTISMGAMGDQSADVKGTMKVAFIVGEPNKETGKADFEMLTSDVKLQFGGMAEMAAGMLGEMPKEISVKAKIDDRNRVTDVKFVGANVQMQLLTGASMQSSGTFIEFPEKAVKVGDTWTVAVPANEVLGIQASKLTAKIEAEKPEGLQIVMTGPIALKMNLGELSKKFPDMFAGLPPVNATTEGVNDVKTEALVEKATGRILKLTATVTSKATTKLEDMGMTSDMKSTMSLKMTLAK